MAYHIEANPTFPFCSQNWAYNMFPNDCHDTDYAE